MSENEKEDNKQSDTGRYSAQRTREIVPPSAKQVRNRLLLYIIAVILLCIAASQDLGGLLGF